MITALRDEGNQTWATANKKSSNKAIKIPSQFNKSTNPVEAMNSWYTIASIHANTAALQAQEINTKYNDLIFGSQDWLASTDEKMSEAVEEVKRTLITTAPTTAKEESINKILKQSCSIGTSRSPPRHNGQLQAKCEEVTISRKMVCIVPNQIFEPKDVQHHPSINNAFYLNNEPQQKKWTFYTNPYKAEQPTINLPPSGPEAISMGRRIKVKGNITLSFLPDEQVLSDRIIFHIDNRLELWNVLIQCIMYNGTKQESGYMNIRNNEVISVGYNCELKHQLLSVPRITEGLARNGSKDNQFSITAKNSSGQYVSGFQNDRLLNHFSMKKNWESEIVPKWNWTGKKWLTKIIYSTLVAACVIGIISRFYTMIVKKRSGVRPPPYADLEEDAATT